MHVEKIFPKSPLGMSQVSKINLSVVQAELRLFGRIDAPAVVLHTEIMRIRSFREAVRLCWMHRRSKGMTRATLAELTGMRASHITDYLHDCERDKRGDWRRDMPAKYIPAFESVTGNTMVSQWLANQSQLTVVESLMAERRAA